jgi:hypothetical protein
MVDDTTLGSIRNMVDYLVNTEETHYQECDEPERSNHIYKDALRVAKWLNMESDLPTKECPACHKLTLEIHGEGITSDGKHYPMENCSDCGYTPSEFHKETKGWLIKTLKSWDTTFDEETDIQSFVEKLRKNERLTPDEYDEILFHLWQNFYDY